MRTIEQVVADFKKAEEAVKAAEQTRDKFKNELQEIYAAAKEALGIKSQSYRGDYS